tara:strand:+ start:144 stop:638 length:495 start_codon:yes stop_codon:yes gene_type:complete
MADTAKVSLSITVLPEAFRKAFRAESFSYSPDSSEGWVMKIINVTTSSANLLHQDDSVVSSTGVASATVSPKGATGDNVKFLFIKNTATTDGSTASSESVYLCFDGGTAAHNTADCMEVPAGMSWFCKPMCTLDDIHVISGDPNGTGTAGANVQCIVAAIIDES